MASQKRTLQAVVYGLLALIPLAVPLTSLDTFTSISVQFFYSDSQIPDLVGFLSEPMEPGWYREILPLQDGSTCLSGMSIIWNLYLIPFVKALGLGARAISVSCMVSHLLFALSLWLMVTHCFPRRNAALFGLLFFTSPWYWGSIFSNTFLSPSMTLSMFGLFLFCRALIKERPLLFLWAGLVLGIGLYGYLVNRVYSVVSLGLMFVWVALAWRRWQEQGKRRLMALGLFTLALLATLQISLANPSGTLHALFHDREMMLGEQYWEDVAPTGPVMAALKNLLDFFINNELRFQALELNLGQAALFVLGVVLVLRRRHLPGAVLIICGGAVYLAGSLFSNEWTYTRMGTMAIPFLIICGLGLDHVATFLGQRKAWARHLVPVLYGLGSITSVLYYANHPNNRPAPIFEVARAVVARKIPMEAVLNTGDVDKAHRERYFIKLALAEAGRHEEARGLQFFEFLDRSKMDEILEQHPLHSVLLVRHLQAKPVMPGVPVKVWRKFSKHYTVYVYAGDKKQPR